jgi:hypothetical protein
MRRNARIAYQRINAGTLRECLAHEGFKLCTLAHIAGDADYVQALATQIRGHLLAGLGFIARDDDRRARACHLSGDAEADAARRTRDERHLARQVEQ